MHRSIAPQGRSTIRITLTDRFIDRRAEPSIASGQIRGTSKDRLMSAWPWVM
jgi:hypothetical protein